ncbi:hypothetical protein acdb102_07690 [Acidothermaceae bacterium B102]|nr:hypothetical protein acdb102_07690 [Acidothermaceae bacterium B102]
MADRPGDLVRSYLRRVVNERDVSAVDELVADDYTGSGNGWPGSKPELRAFYAWQSATRPDWHIDVQDLIEVGECVVVRAHARGTIANDEQGRPLAAPHVGAVEWLAAYRLADGLIARIDLLAVRSRLG